MIEVNTRVGASLLLTEGFAHVFSMQMRTLWQHLISEAIWPPLPASAYLNSAGSPDNAEHGGTTAVSGEQSLPSAQELQHKSSPAVDCSTLDPEDKAKDRDCKTQKGMQEKQHSAADVVREIQEIRAYESTTHTFK